MTSDRFRLRESSDLGRYLTSSRNFDPGDAVWEERPLISVASKISDEASVVTCVGCFKKVTSDQMKCQLCAWPCCSLECSMNGRHRNYECTIFRRRSIPVSFENLKNIVYIRFAMFKSLEPVRYTKLFKLSSEFDHVDFHFQEMLRKRVMSLLKFLATDCELNVSENEVSRMFLIFQTNNFQFRFGVNNADYSGQGVFEYSSLFSHCCAPNLEYSFAKVVASDTGNIDWKIQIYARRSIRVGDVLSISYGPDLIFGTVPRQSQIIATRHFTCRCSRCKDTTEEGTYFSAVICEKCKKGKLLPEYPSEITTSPWKCDFCSCRKSSEFVEDMIEELSVIPKTLFGLRSFDNDSLAMADAFIENHSGTSLYKNHYMLFQCAVHWLAGNTFPPLLIADTEDADNLFTKIMMRLRRYLPIAQKFASTEINANLHFLLAQVLAVYIFQSLDMASIFRSEILPFYQIKSCIKIVNHLEASLVWQRMKPNCINFRAEVSFLNNLIAIWTYHLENMIADYESLEDMALDSLQTLFA